MRTIFVTALLSATGCAPVPPSVSTESDPAHCPDLSGTYAEVGVRHHIAPKKPDQPAHLTSLILTARVVGTEMKYEPEKARLYRVVPGSSMTFVAETIRITHPKRDRIQLQAFDKQGESLGVFEIGREHGWACRDAAFVSESSGRYGGADFTPVHDTYGKRAITRSEDGSLVLARRSSRQEVSLLRLYGPTGAPDIESSEERYAQHTA